MATTSRSPRKQRSLRAAPRRDPVITAALIAAAAAAPIAAKVINPSPLPPMIVIVVPGSGTGTGTIHLAPPGPASCGHHYR